MDQTGYRFDRTVMVSGCEFSIYLELKVHDITRNENIINATNCIYVSRLCWRAICIS